MTDPLRLIDEESEAGDVSDRESIRSVYSLGSFAQYFENPSTDKDLEASLQDLNNGPLAPPRHPYPNGLGTESQYSFYSHPHLPSSAVITPTGSRSTPHDLQESQPPQHATALRNANMVETLNSPGRQEKTLVFIQAAVLFYRDLSQYKPEKYKLDLSNSVHSLSYLLSGMGRYEEALVAIQETVTLCRELVKDQPGTYHRNLAISLFDLNICLASMGRQEEALAAIQDVVVFYQELAKAQPETFKSDQAISFHTLCTRLLDVGMMGNAVMAAREALVLRRELTRDRMFLAVTNSLSKLALHLSDLQLREKAFIASREAVTGYEELSRNL